MSRREAKMSVSRLGLCLMGACLVDRQGTLNRARRTSFSRGAHVDESDSHPIDDPVDAGLPSPARERELVRRPRRTKLRNPRNLLRRWEYPRGGSSGVRRREEEGKRSRGKPDGAASEEHSRKKGQSGKTTEAQQTPGLGSNLAGGQEPLRQEDVAEDRGQPADASLKLCKDRLNAWLSARLPRLRARESVLPELTSDVPGGGSTGQSSEAPAAVVSHVNAPDPILVSEVAEKDTGVEIEVPPAEREEPALTEELASDAAAVDVRSGVPEDAAAVGAQDPSVSGEALV
ncbi:hypothetical protein Bca4012_088237 [Brassica carinata]